MLEPMEKPKRRNWLKVGGLGIIAIVALASGVNLLWQTVDREGFEAAQDKMEAKREAKRVAESASRHANAKAAAEDRKAGFHCLSGWDGSNRDFVRQVIISIRNPDSFEHVETSIYPNDDGEHGAWMTFRAENGFGGMNVERLYARIDHQTCEARVIPGGPGSDQ
ncbi:hypothetical protein [Qipengyuania sp. MTN3-11]|uniref:hypothetical protein n=1 Tax=Qipengyuania sp. MTN3-11 TaxID=3056557 RepID=UPI0036F1CDB9